MATTPLATPTGAPPADTDKEPDFGEAYQQERRLLGAREVTFATRGLNPPSMLYVTADDSLYISVSNLQANQVVTFAAQFLLPDGRLQPNVWTITPPSTGVQTNYAYQLAEGYLFNLTCTPSSATRRGSTWVYAAIRRGSMASGVILQSLLSDYVDTYGGPTWPGGRLHNSTEGTGLISTIYVASLPVNQSSYTYTVPAYARIRIRSIAISLQASATVGNRQMTIYAQDGSNLIYLDTVEPVQAANAWVSYYWALLLGWSQTTIVAGAVTRGLPDIVLNPGNTLKLNANFFSGDQFQAIYLTLEQWFSL